MEFLPPDDISPFAFFDGGKKLGPPDAYDKSYIARIMDLVFLAPDITESIIAGYQSPDLSVEKLTKRIDLPMDWTQQRQLLGFS